MATIKKAAAAVKKISEKSFNPSATALGMKEPKKRMAKGAPGSKTNPIIATFDKKKPAVAKKPVVLRYRGVVININRKIGEADATPVVHVKTVSDTMKLFEKLPKGCSWLPQLKNTHTLDIFNKYDALIVQVRTSV